VSGSPSSIAEAVSLTNALYAAHPEGLTLPCWVESLDRPLATLAVNSLFSAQPSVGPRSPRIFFFSGNLVVSVSVEGIGSHSLELADYATPLRSTKAEIEFPVTAPIAPALPYDRILYDQQSTSCSFCHRDEMQAPEITFTKAFASDVLRPRPQDEVSFPYLVNETSTCDRAKEPERCDMLQAVFGHGELTTRQFPAEAHTIFDY
jgi:hypothetical protein